MTIPQADFDKIRRWTPLVSIDLIVVDPQGRVLLGRRVNEPAKGSWFVPGGRIWKDESLSEAFRRIVTSELGPAATVSSRIEDASPLGVFEHHYPAAENTSTGISVHYIVLGHRLTAPGFDLSTLTHDQHSEWRWFGVNELLKDKQVHDNTKRFFSGDRPMIDDSQYDTLASRRISHDNLLWQTPVLSLTAQAFLFTIAFDESLSLGGRLPAGALVVVVAIASMQLMAKHRAYELLSSRMLGRYERSKRRDSGFAVVHRRLPIYWPTRWARYRSYCWWQILLAMFGAVGLWACIWAGINYVQKLQEKRDEVRCCPSCAQTQPTAPKAHEQSSLSREPTSSPNQQQQPVDERHLPESTPDPRDPNAPVPTEPQSGPPGIGHGG